MLWTTNSNSGKNTPTNSNSGKNTSFTGDPEGYVKGTLWKWAPLYRGPIGEPGGRFIYQ